MRGAYLNLIWCTYIQTLGNTHSFYVTSQRAQYLLLYLIHGKLIQKLGKYVLYLVKYGPIWVKYYIIWVMEAHPSHTLLKNIHTYPIFKCIYHGLNRADNFALAEKLCKTSERFQKFVCTYTCRISSTVVNCRKLNTKVKISWWYIHSTYVTTVSNRDIGIQNEQLWETF